MNTPDTVTLPTPTLNPMPKVFPKKEVARHPVLILKPVPAPMTGGLAGASQGIAPTQSTRLKPRTGRDSSRSRPAWSDRPKENNAAKTGRVTTIAGTVTVHFECIAPTAHSVFVAGSFNEWNPALAALARCFEGRWTGDLALAPGRHEYLFVVDGRWMCDVAANEYALNPFGGCNSVVTVSSSQ